MNEPKIKAAIINVFNLLQNADIKIPVYQRPYKWTAKNVNQLIDDVILHKDKSAYRLGTIVLHEDVHGKLNIVDGQQRTITLILIARAIIDEKVSDSDNEPTKELLEKISNNIIDPEFSNDISITNIRNNYLEIVRRVASFDEDTIKFLFNKCEFIEFRINELSEAFQFFDSQNARGKDLEPHDLLKAYHLREFSETDSGVKTKLVESWESIPTHELANLFGEYLFRVRGWSKSISSRYFTKPDVDLFKGINIEKIENYPYTELIRIAHFFVDRYNSSYERKIDQNQTDFPFQIDQTIINGRRFFEMISHYKAELNTLFSSISTKVVLNENAKSILQTINNYQGKKRVGDLYVRTLFDCALLYYIDKFGYKDVSKAIEKIFIWAYSLRLRHQALQMASMDNYVLYEKNFFHFIKYASVPSDVFKHDLSQIENVNSTKTDEIVKLFKKLRYYDK